MAGREGAARLIRTLISTSYNLNVHAFFQIMFSNSLFWGRKKKSEKSDRRFGHHPIHKSSRTLGIAETFESRDPIQ
jgi:hypothetical protein